jgi:hypothetical protein
VGNGEVEVFLTTRGIRRRLADTYQSQKRYNDARRWTSTAASRPSWSTRSPWSPTTTCPKGFAFAHQQGLVQVVPAGRSRLAGVQGRHGVPAPAGASSGTYNAVWLAWFKWYASFACVAPNRNGVIFNAADDNAS